MEYSKTYGGVKWAFVPYFKPGKLQTLPQKRCAYKIRDTGGKPMVGPGDFQYLESKYKEPQKIKTYEPYRRRLGIGLAQPHCQRKYHRFHDCYKHRRRTSSCVCSTDTCKPLRRSKP